MKAAVHRRYGPPNVVQLEEVDQPIPNHKEVLVKVIASTVNRTDSGFRSAVYVISRFWSGLFYPKHKILGCEFSGIIEKIGPGVSQFKVGDHVFGYNDETFGAHAAFLCIAEDRMIFTKPNILSFQEAAAMTEGSHYALNIIKAAKINKEDHVLVYGATGAIGSAAVQILKYFGVHVTAVCNTKNVTLVKNLGADIVIDYQTEDFTQTNQRFSFIIDAVGKSSFTQCKPLLTPKGIYISTELGKGGSNIWYALITPFLGGKKVLFPIPKNKAADFLFLRELAVKGLFKPVLDRTYPLEGIVEAYEYVETEQKTGNVILQVQSIT